MSRLKQCLKGKRHVKWRKVSRKRVWTQDDLVRMFLRLHEQETGKRIEMIPAEEFFVD